MSENVFLVFPVNFSHCVMCWPPWPHDALRCVLILNKYIHFAMKGIKFYFLAYLAWKCGTSP